MANPDEHLPFAVDSSDPEISSSEEEAVDDGKKHGGKEQDEKEVEEEEKDEAGEEEDEDEEDERKMLMIVRGDLGMSAGKIAAQVSHAVHRLLQKCYREGSEYKVAMRKLEEERQPGRTLAVGNVTSYVGQEQTPVNGVTASPDLTDLLQWEAAGCKKISLEVPSYEALLELRSHARAGGLPTATVKDAGHTEVPPGTVTVLGLGPCASSRLDPITGHLKTLQDPTKALKKELQKRDQEVARQKKQLDKALETVSKLKAEKSALCEHTLD